MAVLPCHDSTASLPSTGYLSLRVSPNPSTAMKVFTLAPPLLFAASAFSQGVSIATPAPGQALKIGQPFTVEIDKPNSLGGGPSVSVAISLQLCGQSPGCSVLDNDFKLGRVLFTGDYSPQRHEAGKQPYQNYTVTVPNDAAPQSAVLHVIHFWLVGAGPSPTLQARNVTLTITQ